MQQGFEACQPFGDVGRLRFEDIRHARNFDKARLDVALFVVVGHDPHTRKTGLKDLALAKRLEFRTNLAFAEGCQDRFLFAGRERNTLQVDDVACAVLCEGRECVSDLVQNGGFPPFFLQPINFEALYAEQQRRRTDATAQGAGANA